MDKGRCPQRGFVSPTLDTSFNCASGHSIYERKNLRKPIQWIIVVTLGPKSSPFVKHNPSSQMWLPAPSTQISSTKRWGGWAPEDSAGDGSFLPEPVLRSPWLQCMCLQVHLRYRAFPCVHQLLALVLPHLHGKICDDISCLSWVLISFHRIRGLGDWASSVMGRYWNRSHWYCLYFWPN